MRVAVVGNMTEGNIDMGKYIPEGAKSILYLKGQYIGECANRYADEHNMPKLGYPQYQGLTNTLRDKDSYIALIDCSEYLLVLYRHSSAILNMARHYAKQAGKPVSMHFVGPWGCMENS